MMLSEDQLLELTDIACEAAREAGRLIASYSDQTVEVNFKQGGDSLASQVVTEVDCKCEALILEYLQPTITKYDLALLSEEREDDGLRLVKDYFWCIDPLDGTLAFTESKPGYAVSIALVSKSGCPVIGAVFDPVTDTLYSAAKGLGAERNGKPWALQSTDEDRQLTLACDLSLVEKGEFPAMIKAFELWAEKQGLKGVNKLRTGGAVMSACTVFENPPACYFKAPKPQEGGGSSWDFAATACMSQELGAIVCDFDGEPLDLNCEASTFMNRRGVIFTSNKEMVEVIRSIALTE